MKHLLENLFTAFGIASFAIWLIHISPIIKWVKKKLKKKEIKPFDCEHCLSAWLSIIYMMAIRAPLGYFFIFPAIAAIIAILLYKLINL